MVETETPPRKADLLQLLAQVGEGLAPAQAQALQQAIENLTRSVDQIGGEHIPLYRGITSDDEPKGLWEDGVCQACLSEAGPDERDEDLRHDPLCHYYRGKRLHVHNEACADNPLCVLLYQGEPPP